MRKVVLIVDNVRSTHNVGSIFRSCDGFGVSELILCGITPYPTKKNDVRLPHLSKKIETQIFKTSLGAEKTVSWRYVENTEKSVTELKKQGYEVVALEQTNSSLPITNWKPTAKVALIVGNELDGVGPDLLKIVDQTVEIPMRGQKESLNVSVAAAVALFYIQMN